MRRLICVLCAILGIATFAATPTITGVMAKQRYPWNGMVDIDYEITGDTDGMTIEVSVEDVQNGKTYTPTKFLSSLPLEEGRHRITWSTTAEGVTMVSTNVVVTLSLVRPDSVLYYVVNLSSGPNASSYPVTTLSASPIATWSDEYKKTKLVLRRIEPGVIPTRSATITKPFFIGVFEVTQKQYELVMGSNPSYYKGDMRAVNGVSYNKIRGAKTGACWPFSSAVDATSFLGKLRSKSGIDFDLPTEAQWEYACRAGTTSAYNNGGDSEFDIATLGRCLGNSSDGRGGYSNVTVVGSYAPNAWGLYDMHGNVWEWCLDWSGGALSGNDPVGGASSSFRVLRGGSYGRFASDCTSSSWYIEEPGIVAHRTSDGYDYDYNGFRIACSAGM